MNLLGQSALFALALIMLVVLSRWITERVQIIGLRVSGNGTFTILAYYLLMFPGILLHELSHFGMARLLGLRVGKFTMGPKRRRNAIELGSVTVSSGGALRDSLVGLAPFIVGTTVLLLVSYSIFDVAVLSQVWATGGWSAILEALRGFLAVPDFWLWVYLIFVISNAMMPSPADRQPWLVAGLYLLLALAIVWLLGGLPIIASAVGEEVRGTLQLLTLGFLFTIGVNLMIAIVLWMVDFVLAGVTSTRQ